MFLLPAKDEEETFLYPFSSEERHKDTGKPQRTFLENKGGRIQTERRVSLTRLLQSFTEMLLSV